MLVEQLVALASQPWGAMLIPGAPPYALLRRHILELEGIPAAMGASSK